MFAAMRQASSRVKQLGCYLRCMLMFTGGPFLIV